MSGRVLERMLLVLILIVLPVLFVLLVLLPSRGRMEARKARMEVISARLKALPEVQPLSAQESRIMLDPDSRWQRRIPLLDGDAERLAHYHGVVGALQTTWKSDGVTLEQLRTSWDGLKGSYSLPRDLGTPNLGLPQERTAAAGRLQGWVLDATIGGTPDRLFRAMAALPRVDPLLEPVGLRWESMPDHTRQSLLLRNLILAR
jgi:hypothetical protein